MIALLLLAACQPAPSFEKDVWPVLVGDGCLDCHAPGDARTSLDLVEDPYTALLEEPSLQSPLALVEPGDSLYSYLFHKLNGSQMLAEGSGTRMPYGQPLPPEHLDLVRAWIDSGARY